MRRVLHIDVETTGGLAGRCIWDIGYIITDAAGKELSRRAMMVAEALPFLAADRFWGQRKNDLLVQNMHKREILPACEVWQDLQTAMHGCAYWIAFNSRYEASAFMATAKCLRLPELVVPAECDLALAAFDILPLRKYAKWAIANGCLTEKGNVSSKCEHLLEWLGLGGANHCHLALEDTETQVELFRILKKRKRKFPSFGERLTHIAHPAWRKHLWKSA